MTSFAALLIVEALIHTVQIRAGGVMGPHWAAPGAIAGRRRGLG